MATEISCSRSDKSGGSVSWDFVATIFKPSKDVREEILQKTGKVQNADRLD